MAGYSILMNTIWVMLVYYYLPPSNSNMPVLVPQIVLWGVFTVLSLVLASGRLVDALTDPIIAWLSDRNQSRWGRRIPFMAIAIVPTVLFSVLVFMPPLKAEAYSNFGWLFAMQTGFYLSVTLYIVPYNALMPELAKTSDEKLIFSTYLSLAFIAGMIFASQIPWLAEKIRNWGMALDFRQSYFYSILVMNFLAFLFLMLPILAVNEKKYCSSIPVSGTPLKSLKHTLSDKNFRIFLIADASFFLTLALISTGLIYYVKVLTGLSDSFASLIMGLMVFFSLCLYPLIIIMVRVFGKKKIIISSFFVFSLLLFYTALLGKIPLPPKIQLYILCVAGAYPIAALGILPYAITADLAHADVLKTGEQKEGMYFAVKTFMGKTGQTIGVIIFTVFTIWGKDPGDDLGIRLSAIAGGMVTLFAASCFFRFRE
jgi:glycoside/pentoside/hexuronide:cation symporter, GPH family